MPRTEGRREADQPPQRLQKKMEAAGALATSAYQQVLRHNGCCFRSQLVSRHIDGICATHPLKTFRSYSEL